MAKLTLDALRKIRGEKQKEMEMRDSSNKDVQVIVGMGTCGIAAGAKDSFTVLVDMMSEKGLTNVPSSARRLHGPSATSGGPTRSEGVCGACDGDLPTRRQGDRTKTSSRNTALAAS